VSVHFWSYARKSLTSFTNPSLRNLISIEQASRKTLISIFDTRFCTNQEAIKQASRETLEPSFNLCNLPTSKHASDKQCFPNASRLKPSTSCASDEMNLASCGGVANVAYVHGKLLYTPKFPAKKCCTYVNHVWCWLTFALILHKAE